jgi:hypothetical protein
MGAITENFKRLTLHGAISRSSRRLWAEKGYARQLEQFIDGIRRGAPPSITVRDGARATLGCLKMLESARTLEPRALDLDALLS